MVENPTSQTTESAMILSDLSYAIILLTIIILAGIIGGIASYFLSESDDKSPIKSIVIGVVASFIVPVFLNMISSNLLVEAQLKIDKIFIFTGFCVLAAVFSRNFLENVYSKVMQQVGNLEKKVDDAAVEPSLPENDVSSDLLSKAGLTSDQYKILIELLNGRFTYRTSSGLRKDSGFDKPKFETLLNELIAKSLIDAKPNKENKLRYSISSHGRKILGEISINSEQDA
jgi:DNA-binding MarR family transcriptional regulator/uncharacterized membrane protein YeaQ/YmgE (transglycosylase-associated protein family)